MVCMSVNAQATSGSCGDNVTWSYAGTTLTISGTGTMADYNYGEAPWFADYGTTMTSLVIESGITSIGNNAFAGCTNLNSVQYPASGFTSIGDYAFSGAKMKYPNLPRTLTHLGTGAFAGSQAKGVAIPASLKKIPDYAFEGCANLEGVSIYEGVEEIGESAFDGCAFSVITIPNTVTTIGTCAFMSNTTLETVYIGAGVKTIYDAAFQGCTGLKEVGIGGNSKPTLGNAVFDAGDGVTPLDIEAFYVPYGVNYDGWGGFDSEKFKTEMLGTWTNSEGAEQGSGNWRFDIYEGKLTVSGTGKLNVAPWNDEPAINPIVYQDEEHPGFWGGIKSAVFGNGITSLENMVCGMQINCASVTLPSTLKTITNSALEECAFTSIDLPEGLETIDMYAFFGSKLTSVVIPSTVTKLGYSVFLYNENLAVVTLLPTTPPTLEAELPFGECEALTAIYVPTGCAATYQAADGWSTYADLIKDAPNTTFTYTATEKVTKFDTYANFKGAMSVKSHEYDEGTQTGTVVYEGYVTAIGESALTYTKLTGITIPESVISIDNYALQDNDNLASVTFAGTPAVASIGKRAFAYNEALVSFAVPASVKTIDENAFSNCEMQDVYCYASPTITWDGGMKDDFSMMNPKSTKFHVLVADQSDWETNFPDANVTFVGDLAPAVAGNAVEDAYWATYYNSAANMKVDANTIVYKAAINGNTISLTEIADNVITAGEAVVLKSTGANISMITQAAASTADYTGNVLEGVDVATAVDANYKYYVLSNENSTLGFYRYTGATLGANKAFIKTNATGAPEFFTFNDGTTTSLRETVSMSDARQQTYFDLQGRRVVQPTKGMYIVNGKKVVMK